MIEYKPRKWPKLRAVALSAHSVLMSFFLLVVSCAHSPGPTAHGVRECEQGLTYMGPDPIPRPADIQLPQRPFETKQMRQGRQEALEAAFTTFAERAPAWSIAVVGERGSWHKTTGAAPESRFHAASIGKSMTAAVVLQLVEEGKLNLSDTVAKWLPDLPHASLVTIDQLLTHRSGYLLRSRDRSTHDASDETLEELEKEDVAFCPGTNWAYSNEGYIVLGEIISAVEGESFADILERRILDPLELHDTYVYRPNRGDALRVSGHVDGAQVSDANFSGAGAAAPVSSTAADLVVWWQALLAGRVVSEESLEIMIREGWPLFGNVEMTYGRGVQIAQVDGPGPMIMHSGSITGFAATVAWLPRHDVVVAVMANEQSVSPEAAMWSLVQAMSVKVVRTAKPVRDSSPHGKADQGPLKLHPEATSSPQERLRAPPACRGLCEPA